MADITMITMCTGGRCPSKERCYRYTATPGEYGQSYFVQPPYLQALEGCCDQFWAIKGARQHMMQAEKLDKK
jgi:hypothetical protein